MAATAAAAGTPAPADTSGGGAGMNPFWECSNLFAQPNKLGALASQTHAATVLPGGAQINAGNFLRGLRLVVRSGGGAGTPTADNPWNFFQFLGVQNTDGSEILYQAISGYAYYLRQKYFRPWLRDPALAYDYAQSASPSFTLFLDPEVRQQAGVLENTDTRSQYTWTQTVNTTTAVGDTSTAATIAVTPYVDMWAQPDDHDLNGVPNQRIPPGANLQTKTRHQTFTLNSASSDNNFLSTLTGSALRGAILVVRDGQATPARQDYLTSPIVWTLDQRSLGSLAPDNVFEWMEDQYQCYGSRTARETGVYVFPRFYSPGSMYGQGWLYTANNTAVNWETTTLSTGSNLPGTVELLQEEIYPVGPVDETLLSI
jgi:hypothetical protein